MTGFKSGASPSGLDDDENDEESGANETSNSTQKTEQRSPMTSSQEESEETKPTTSTALSGLPWIYQRSSITDGRAKTVQLHLQQETLDKERDVKTKIESQMGETVNKADLREAG